MLIQAAGEEVSAVNAAVQLGKLLQISSGAVYADTGETVQFDASNKLNEMLNVVQQASHKTLIFCAFRHSIDIVGEFLKKHGVSSDAIHGGVSPKRRTEIFKKFQESTEPHVLIIQPQAAAHGVTLTAANTVIWFSPTTSAETYLQANARVHRAGQRNPCLVVHLCSSGVEKQLYKALEDRTLAQNNLLSMYKNFLGGDI
jgi:SNF2 family DNA or RNA helicase